MPSSLQKEVMRYSGLIEAEMRRIGYWQKQPLRPEQMQFTQAFAMDTLTFTQWLQFIFLPAAAASARKRFASSTAITNAGNLVALLAEFDALFD